MLITVKTLLGQNINDHANDQLLNTYCDIMTQKVKNYCNITSIPTGLKDIVAEMAAALYRKQSGLSAQTLVGAIKKETVGNHTVEYATDSSSSSSSNASGDILNDYTMQLNPFRRIKFV